MNKIMKLLLMGVLSGSAVYATSLQKDAQKRYAMIVKHSKDYFPIPENMIRTEKPMLLMNEWGVSITGIDTIERADDTSVTCADQYPNFIGLLNEDMKSSHSEDEVPYVVYIAGKGWFYHRKVLDSYHIDRRKLEAHIIKCVHKFNDDREPIFIIVPGEEGEVINDVPPS